MEELLTFGEALEALKLGKRAKHLDWDQAFLFLLPAGNGIPTKVIQDPALRNVIENVLRDDKFDAHGSIRMLTEDQKILTGWTPSQEEMLCEDWLILD